MTNTEQSPVDILLVAALKMELNAALNALSERDVKMESDEVNGLPVQNCQLTLPSGRMLRLVAARPTRMGPTATSTLASTLTTSLKPHAIAMCGVCAGNPAEVALGDVVIAELAFAHDEGRRTTAGFEPDHRQIPMDDQWLHLAQELTPNGLPSFGPAAAELLLAQVVRAVAEGRKPTADLLVRRLANGDARSALVRAEDDGLIRRTGPDFQLTAAGTAFLDQASAYGEAPWTTLPFSIRPGPMASGGVVVKDGVTWDSLRIAGVRTITALDMEAAAIAQVAHRLRVPHWIVVKGIMDYADPAKDDRVKPFAARAAADVLLRFLEHATWPSSPNELQNSPSINTIGDVNGSFNDISQVFKPQ
ncbi:5'-methylthioadenosine/S-adenosylhomocysteine nucleosidase family protein [Acetobacter cerevisiae]|uniref:5'-methylthioadenosine/S-adenosylhomocysteine nucleosidase family protein n=1 Tax=Acetobacter cerevisiae TaxID=178900 RepID=UPI000781B0A2|nr:hypothetical protein [Acetobacter cerevisiae]